MFSINLSGKVAVITGASRGIGKAIAEVFADAGADLILLSRDEKKLQGVEAGLKPANPTQRIKYHVLDVSNPKSVEDIFNQIKDIDILVNNAGIYFSSPIIDMDIKKWKELLDINLNGAMYCTKSVLPKMIKKKWGRIINISSISGKNGDAFSGAYASSKFALIGFTQSTANETARDGITANAICPGWTETDMAEGILHDDKYAKLVGIPKEELKTSSLEAVPIGRYVHPKEVGFLALYLASDYASAITGQSINIDGGICMH